MQKCFSLNYNTDYIFTHIDKKKNLTNNYVLLFDSKKYLLLLIKNLKGNYNVIFNFTIIEQSKYQKF